MIAMPAFCLGIVIVFLFGYGMTYWVTQKIENNYENPGKWRWLPKRSKPLSIDKKFTSTLGGIILLGFLALLYVTVPPTSQRLIWYIFIGIGILIGLLSFFLAISQKS